MNSNVVICRNEVLIEGENIGQFENFEMQADSHTLGNSAILTLPLYAIGAGEQSGAARSRVRTVFKNNIIRPCAQVEVFCWYEGMEKINVFSGFITHVEEGFPAKLHLMDNAFILRFGNVQKVWNENATLQDIIKDVIPIAQDGFKQEREIQGLSRAIPELTYSVKDTNVQAITSSLSFRNWGGRSPYDTIQKLMQLLVLYGGVNEKYNVFVGAGVRDSERPVIELDTRFNVINREIVPVDGRFVDYDVKVTGILKTGKQYTATGGYGTSKTKKPKNPLGETVRAYSVMDNPEAIQNHADRLLDMLKGVRNKGRITLLMYPKMQIMDWAKYNDTVFPELSAGYYVIGYRFEANEEGYYQYLDVTDQVFAL